MMKAINSHKIVDFHSFFRGAARPPLFFYLCFVLLRFFFFKKKGRVQGELYSIPGLNFSTPIFQKVFTVRLS